MSFTSKLFKLKNQIDSLSWWVKCNPGDYMAEFELNELQIKYDRISRFTGLGLKVVQGGRQSSKSSTEKKRQVS